MALNLENKTVVVTGAARGIGQHICIGFARAGAEVIGIDIQEMAETSAQVSEQGSTFRQVQADMADPESIREACSEVLAKSDRIDALVNNAALYSGLSLTPLEAIDLDEWDRVMAINVRGPYLMVRGLLPALRKARGRIVNVASGSARRGSPFLLHYVASKGAVIAMTRAMATELGKSGICVNAIAPGLIDTESSRQLGDAITQILESTVQQQAIPEKMQASDIVGTILYLASDLSRSVTGQTINIDRGLVKS